MQNAVRARPARVERIDRVRRPRLAPLAAAVTLYFSAHANAATIAVNDASDDSVLGKCTLVDAVAALNTATAVNACIAGDGNNDTIDLSFFTQATTIALSLPTSADGLSGVGFVKPATLSGPLGTDGKPLVTIRRSATSGVNFRVLGTGTNLTIQGVTVTGGTATARGAGVYASGSANLSLSNAIVTGNTIVGVARYSGGGIALASGDLVLTNSIVSGNSASRAGGGIYVRNAGNVTLVNSTVDGNRADYSGGGIYNFGGEVTATGSTISNNAIGYIYHYNGNDYLRGGTYGGGIFLYKKITLTNSTVSGNFANFFGGGVFVGGAFYGGRPGLRAHPQASPYLSGNAYVYFSTIAGNTVSQNFGSIGGLDGPNYLKSVASLITGNSSGDLQLAFPGVQFAGSNNIIGSPPPQAPPDTVDCDPKLTSLANFGGPTQTMALLAGSCAIDAGPETPVNGITTDQRGLPRLVGTKTDVGAVEKQGDSDPPDLIFVNGFE